MPDPQPTGNRAFPADFLWGAATAGHQIEGGNLGTDMWAAEWAPDSFFAEPSGDACDSYHRYGEDLDLVAAAGLNAYRFSIEWSRIEPEDGWFSTAALDHYRRMLDGCHSRGITPVVTYNHFSVPRWFAIRGGWASDDAADRFGRYCERAAAHLGDLIPWACTLNEPNIAATMRHIGIAPVGDEDMATQHTAPPSERVEHLAGLRQRSTSVVPPVIPAFQLVPTETMATAHRRAVDAIKSGPGDCRVGWTLALIDVQAADGGHERTEHAVRRAQLDWLDVSRDDDFVGVQTYSRSEMGPDGLLPVRPGAPKMLTGWEVYPDALEHTVRLASHHAGVPVLVTENGCATDDDEQRIAGIDTAVDGLARCLADHIDVAGYLHWSLLDNFEWVAGYRITFGLVAVDAATFARTPKPSLHHLGAVARRNR